jgi:retron-type reverse transcriptase
MEMNYESILSDLQWKLKNQLYYPKSYTKFLVFEPKKRQVAAPHCHDRIVHHAIINIIEPLTENFFIHNSYACQKSKGGFKARSEIAEVYRQMYKQTPIFYALKCDIKSYFASINHQVLLTLLKKFISCEKTIRLLQKIINSYSETPGTGIPIGNLTSQLFANLYLHPLDIFVTQMVGEKNYFRYMDDFLILSPDKEYLLNLRILMKGFLKYYLKLNYHPKKNNIFRADKGVEFVGYLIKPDSITMRKKTIRKFKKRHKKRIKLLKKLIIENKLDEADILKKKLLSSKSSLRGFLKDTNYESRNNLLRINGIIMPPEL